MEYKVPSKEQAIIMNATDGLKIKGYIIAVGNKVGPKNIIFASRISNNRICVYLQSKEVVGDIMEKHNFLQIESNKINVRRLKLPQRELLYLT